ncbi:MAG: hypothetical protein ACLFTP_04500 [Rhodosalinus sp.]
MSEPIDLPAHEAGVIRVFALDLPEAEAERWRAPEGCDEGDDPLARALGADPFDRTYAEVIRVADLGAMSLSTYLAEGYGLPEDELASLRGRLDALTGHVAVTMSSAFGGKPQRLEVRAPLRLVARLTEEGGQTPRIALGSGSGHGTISPAPVPPPPARRTSPVLALLALLVLALLVAAVVLGGGR